MVSFLIATCVQVRCIYSGSNTCDNCLARSRTCVAQGPASPSLEPATASRDRIRSLEHEVTSLWSVVRRLEASTGIGNPISSARSYETPGSLRRANDTPAQEFVHNQLRPTSPTAVSGQSRGERASMEMSDSESESLELSPTNQPAHLRQLFDNDLLNSREQGSSSRRHGDSTGFHPAAKGPLIEARRQLQRLIPTREDVATISGFSAPWLNIYVALFPRVRTLTNPEETVARYEEMCAPDANPMFIANVLISMALTVRQIPVEDVRPLVPSIGDPSRFIGNVSEAVDRTIVSNDVLAATMVGIQTSLFFTRL